MKHVLKLSPLAYNLGICGAVWCCRREFDAWSLTSLQQRLVKTGGRLMKHARYYWLLLAESHLTRRPFGSMLGLRHSLHQQDRRTGRPKQILVAIETGYGLKRSGINYRSAGRAKRKFRFKEPKTQFVHDYRIDLR
jgi:hypothetical protein